MGLLAANRGRTNSEPPFVPGSNNEIIYDLTEIEIAHLETKTQHGAFRLESWRQEVGIKLETDDRN